METALCALAQSEPDLFSGYADVLEQAQSETLDFLLVRAFAAAPTAFAERAARFLIDKPVRLHAGYTSDSYWAARELAAAILPVLGPDARAELEAAILGFYPSWERSKDGHRSYGEAQFTILTGLPPEALSARARSRLAEWRRKFGSEPEPPTEREGGFVGPPIEPVKALKMTDPQWLRAIAKYDVERAPRYRPIARAGGRLELARLLQEHTKAEPERFARLALGFPSATSSVYLEGVLRGLETADTKVERGLVFDLVRRAHELPGQPCGRVVCDVIAAHAATGPLPDDIVSILEWYATEAPDPAEDRAEEWTVGPREREDRFDSSGYAGMELLNQGMNSDRGAAVLALGKVLRSQPRLLGRLESTINAVVIDPMRAVRTCVTECLLAALPIDRDRAVGWYVVVASSEPAVAASAPGARFLRYALRTHPDKSLPIVEQLLVSELPESSRVGAREACLAAFSLDRAKPLAAAALLGGPAARFGAAEVYAANLGDPAVGNSCEEPLRRLFRDEDRQVRREAASCFRSLDGDGLARHLALLEDFVPTQAIADNANDVLDAILLMDGQLPDLAATVGLRIVEIAGGEAGNIATAWSAQMPDVCALAVRLNAFGSPRGRALGLDLFDRLSEVGAYGLDKALRAVER
jgi:hypothetical protein